ncbi:MAG: hypothetical protein AAGK97_13080, partial [Bacteroidota bacterium]
MIGFRSAIIKTTNLFFIVVSLFISSNLLGQNIICFTGTDGDNSLFSIDDLGTETLIGSFGSTDIEAIAFNDDGTILYAVNGNVFGTISTTTGTFAPIGAGIGSGNGSAGAFDMNDIKGLTLDPFNNLMYASVRRLLGPDLLIIINQNTGQIVTSAFGPGIDYVEIDGAG